MAQQQGLPVTPAELLQMIGELTVENRVLRNQVQELAGRLRGEVGSREAQSSKVEGESGTMNDE